MSITYTPTTELEAVNAILAASDEAPINALPSSRPDVVLAQAALAASLRETLASRWRFNSDINYRLAGVGFSGAFVYPEPAGLIAFTVTPTEAQRGLDIVARLSRTYTSGGVSVRILTNRVGGSDTLTQSELFINPVWAVAFDDAPETARNFIVKSAIRRRMSQSGYTKDQVEAAAADEQSALSALQADEGINVNQSVPFDGWANETDALNSILATAGQAGVTDVLEADGPSLVALNALRQAVTDCCAMGWRFNTELGYGISPLSVVYNWNDVDGTVTPVLIYEAPARVLNIAATVCDGQEGTTAIDPIVTKAERYRDALGAAPLVVRDRANHRDGFPSEDRTIIWLDVTWRKPFDEMPEEARRYATIVAGRRYCASLGSTPRWTPQDELGALRSLQRAEVRNDKRNLFRDNPSMSAFRGRRRFAPPPGLLW